MNVYLNFAVIKINVLRFNIKLATKIIAIIKISNSREIISATMAQRQLGHSIYLHNFDSYNECEILMKENIVKKSLHGGRIISNLLCLSNSKSVRKNHHICFDSGSRVLSLSH